MEEEREESSATTHRGTLIGIRLIKTCNQDIGFASM